MFLKPKERRIYLDYASATPVRDEVLSAMQPYWSEKFGNAGAIHKEGVTARIAIDAQRETLAAILHVRPQGIVFTGSGTESNNLAIFGTLEAKKREGVAYADMEILSSAIEHPSILEALKHAQSLGVRVSYVPLLEDGLIDTQAFESCVTEHTVLVTLAYANSEIGTVQPIGRISRMIRAAEKRFSTRIYVHVDAAQAPLWLPCALDKIGADMLSLDAGKCYGPKGIGILALRHGVTLRPQLFGGSQEGGLRPGTENTALIAGAVTAIALAQKEYESRSERIALLRDAFIQTLLRIEGVVLNGSRIERIANNINVSLSGFDSEFAVIALDEAGIACSTKSACGGAKGDGSHVVRAITHDEARAKATIRFTLGESTKMTELDQTVRVLKTHLEKMKMFRNEGEIGATI